MSLQPFISQKHKLVGVPLIDAVKGLFPTAPVHMFNGQEIALVPHDETSVFMLRKMGFDVPSPILTQYDFPHPLDKPPFDVQKKTTAMLTMAERAYVLNGMGTGKTKCIIWAWDYLRKVKRIGKLLVVCPLSTTKFTWQRELFEVMPNVKSVVLHGDRKRRIALLNDPDAEIFIINHDGIKTIEKELLAHPDIDACCIDELAVYRNKSDRTKCMKTIAAKMKWVWGCSGSPIPTSPTDVYHQASIVTPERVPKYFSHFRDSLMLKINNFKYVPKDDAVDRAFAVMQPAVRYTIDEVTELPECIERFVDVELGPNQTKIYKQLVAFCQANVGQDKITAANAGAVMSKLLQVSMGWVYNQDGHSVPLDNEKRIEALMDAVAGTDRKMLVFVPFKHALAGISEALTKEGVDHAVVSGDTSATERNSTFNLFQNTQKYKVLLAHPQCLAHGITLTAADTVVWFAPVVSLEIYDQANHRIKRVGQKFKQLILHLQSTAVERKIYKMLQNHQDVQNSFLSMFENSNEEW